MIQLINKNGVECNAEIDQVEKLEKAGFKKIEDVKPEDLEKLRAAKAAADEKAAKEAK